MIILIIFLTIISVLTLLLFLWKIKVYISFRIDNFNFQYTIKIFSKEICGMYRLEKKLKNHHPKWNRTQNQKPKESINFQKIFRFIQIKNLKISAYLGLLLMNPTIIGVTLFSTLIPLAYQYVSKEKKGLSYHIYPLYDTLGLKVSGELLLVVTPVLLFQIFILLKRQKTK